MAGSKTEKLAEGLKAWLQKPGNWLRLLILAAALAGLAAFAVWLGRPVPGEVPTSASQMVYEKAKVTAVLSDDAAPDYENAEGRRVGSQELEIRVLTGEHKGEIMTLTNYMSALFNVDLEKGRQHCDPHDDR